MFEDLVGNKKRSPVVQGYLKCPVCHEERLREKSQTQKEDKIYRNFECEICGSKYSLMSLGI